MEEPVVQRELLCNGITALTQYVAKKDNKNSILGDGSKIHLTMCMKKIPRVRNKIIKIILPHSHLPTPTDVCLFTRDLDKNNRDYSPTERHFQSLLHKNGITNVAKILPMKAIKLEYQPFEAKRNLSDMHDVYLADASIVRLLPGFLGKHFYGRKRFPLQVNLDSKKLKTEFECALRTTQCILSGKGSMFGVDVGHTGMSVDDLTSNIESVIQKVSATLPGGHTNIRNINIKTTHSPSIPLYVAFGSGEDVQLPPKQKRKILDDPEDVDTVIGAKVRITPYGRIDLISAEGKRVQPSEGGEMTKVPSGKPRRKKAVKKITKITKKSISKIASKVENDVDSVKETLVNKKRKLESHTDKKKLTSDKKAALLSRTIKKPKRTLKNKSLKQPNKQKKS